MILPGPVVDTDWLRRNLDEIEIADVRWSLADGPKAAAFLDGHLPSAVFVDLDSRLSDPPGRRGRHPLPSVDRFRRLIAELGLGRRPTVCYDDASGATAARMWWMLDAIGHPCAVLDGGLVAWAEPLEVGPARSADGEPAEVVVGDPLISDWPSARLVDVRQVRDRVAGGLRLLDARSADRFRGEPNPIDPTPGHIPGSRSRPWTDNIGADGRFRSGADLRRELAELGVDESGEWIASCGSGVTACHNLLAARLAGLADGALYAGSWSEWIADPTRPVETGPTPGPG